MSAPIVLASPPFVPPPPKVRLDEGWDRLQMWLVDRFDRRWDVSDWQNSGLFFMQGVKGMDHPPLRHQRLDYSNTHGAVWNGLLADPRPVWWPVYMFKDSNSLEYLEHIGRWWDAVDPFHTIDWYVRSPAGEIRRLTVRMQDHGGPGSDFDDVYYGWAKFGMDLTADDPWWYGETISRRFTASAPIPFFGPDGNNAPPFRPFHNATLATASIPNPGKVDAPVRWTLEGPIELGAQVGFDDAVIDVPFEIPGGSVAVIDTDPELQITTLDGSDVTNLMTGSYDMTLLPPGSEVHLNVNFTGNGSVTAEVTPRYWRAYG